MSGRVVRGEHGPTAIETKLGWVLSGPIPEGTQVNRQQSNLVTTHVLKSAVKPVDVTNETLDGTLKTFWELESRTFLNVFATSLKSLENMTLS